MINKEDLYSISITEKITSNKVQYGTLTLNYEVNQLVDTKNLKSTLSYQIKCTARINIPNKNKFSLTPSNIQSYNDYPGMLTFSNSLNGVENSDGLEMLGYSPRTINTTISTSANSDADSSSSYSNQNTVGSSTSQTNSFQTDTSFKLAKKPSMEFGVGTDSSTTTSESKSKSKGSTEGRDQGISGGSSMSIKDWGGYAKLELSQSKTSWVWGQEYPWNIIQYRCCPTDNNVTLPPYVQRLLFYKMQDTILVAPPSQLSLFGIDFVMNSAWQIELPPSVEEQKLTLSHNIEYLTASHGLADGTPYVRLTANPIDSEFKSPALDLTLLGLDPISYDKGGQSAVVGFSKNKFVVPPKEERDIFKIISSNNDLQVTGKGFDSAMCADFSSPVELIVQFKAIDNASQYSLFMKHWKISEVGCVLSVVCNDNPPIEFQVDDSEGAGGTNNLLCLCLRNNDFASADYHDYLNIGLNTIKISITPLSDGASYQLRTISIREN